MRWVLVLAVSMLAGCLGGDGPQDPPEDADDGGSLADWRDAGCDKPQAVDSGARPDLVLHDGDAARRLAWTGGAYEETARGPAGTRHVATLNGTMYTATSEAPFRVLALDGNRTVGASEPFRERITALGSGEGLVWVASNWTLVALDRDLQEVGWVDTPPPHDRSWKKEVDHIVVAGGQAHLIDDVIQPFWAFLVDVRDPAAMALLATVEAHGSSSPAWQWVDPGRSWWIQTNFAGMGAGHTGAVRFDLAGGGAEEVGHVRIWSVDTGFISGGPHRETGFSVLASTAVAPVWAVLSVEGEHQFRHVLMDDAPTMACGTPLELPLEVGFGTSRTTLVQHDDVVLGTVGDHLLAWAVDGRPVLVHAQVLPFTPVQVALA